MLTGYLPMKFICLLGTCRWSSYAYWVPAYEVYMPTRYLPMMFICLLGTCLWSLYTYWVPAYEVYMPTRYLPVKFIYLLGTCLWRWNRQGVLKCWHINCICRWITQKKAYNVHGQNFSKAVSYDKTLLLVTVGWQDRRKLTVNVWMVAAH
jgi:hypothetical protein